MRRDLPSLCRDLFLLGHAHIARLTTHVADLLGHRSLDAVAVYAKVDHARLLENAVDWPEVTP